jgi:hypothetical protein
MGQGKLRFILPTRLDTVSNEQHATARTRFLLNESSNVALQS